MMTDECFNDIQDTSCSGVIVCQEIKDILDVNLDEVIKKQCNAHWQTVMELIYLLNWAIKNNKINGYMVKNDEDETVLTT